MHAVNNKNVEIVKILLKYGADLNIKDEEGKIALDYVKETYRTTIFSQKKQKCQDIINLIENKQFELMNNDNFLKSPENQRDFF